MIEAKKRTYMYIFCWRCAWQACLGLPQSPEVLGAGLEPRALTTLWWYFEDKSAIHIVLNSSFAKAPTTSRLPESYEIY